MLLAGLAPMGIACRRKASDSESGAKPGKDDKVPPLLPPKADEIDFSYAIELLNGAKRVPANHPFKSGDTFRVVVRPAFGAHLYLFNRTSGEEIVYRLFPQAAIGVHNPLAENKEAAIPEQKPFRFDQKAGTENFVIVVASLPLPDLDSISGEIGRQKFEQLIAGIQQQLRPQSMRQFQDGDWTKVIASPSKQIAVIIQLPLKHS